MHQARLLPVLALAALVVVALAACSSGAAAGWTFAPPPSATAAPSTAPGSAAPGSAAPGSAAPGSAAPSAATGGTLLTEVATGVQFQTTTLDAPAGQPFQIEFDNQDAGIPHDIEIQDGSGALVFVGDTINGPAKVTYNVPALAAGTYKFICKWHPNMVGQMTAK
ncbi:MAG: cupredoxin domain-containing protein [Chloroflexota bacterium]|nr:cupredoxin domain-containing protein [Chloroflexota bacterium]